jgi:hypothetical protein
VLAPSAASAAQRYASPTGSGAVCDAVNPCGLTNAVSGATTGDEVIVAPGDYALTATLRQVNRSWRQCRTVRSRTASSPRPPATHV